jgi:PKD repeat protein
VDFGDGTLVGAVPPAASHTYIANGTYTATAIAFSSCRTDTVVQGLVVNSIGLEELSGVAGPAGWLYPNPVFAGASVRWQAISNGLGSSEGEGLSVRWVNALGQEVARGSWEADALAVPHLPAGRYWVEWIGPNGIPVRLSIGVR